MWRWLGRLLQPQHEEPKEQDDEDLARRERVASVVVWESEQAIERADRVTDEVDRWNQDMLRAWPPRRRR